jgi:hypothetical protein
MVHMNMHGNDWQGRHRSAATFLASIMMRGKIIWWMVGSIPHSSMTACTSRSRSHSHPGAERVNARRRGRPPLPCTRPGKRRGARHGNGSWLAKATRRSSRNRAYYGLVHGVDEESRLAMARNLARLVIHVAGLWSLVRLPGSLKSYPLQSLVYISPKIRFWFAFHDHFKSEQQLSEGATNGRQLRWC